MKQCSRESRTQTKKTVQKLLHIIVAATRLLTREEMNIALAIEDHYKRYDDLDLGSETRFAFSVRNLCRLFVSVVDQKIYLIHQTAKELFLVPESETVASGWRHSLHPVESELHMPQLSHVHCLREIIPYILSGLATQIPRRLVMATPR